MRIVPIMTCKTLLAATLGSFLLFSVEQAFAEHLSSSFPKVCQAQNVEVAGASTADGPAEPGTGTGPEKAQTKPSRSAEDAALSERLQDLIANRLQQYVVRSQDRTAIEAFYRERNFTPFWVNAAGALPSARKTVDFLHGVSADGLDPKDYPTPTFADRDPARLAADEVTLTNSIATFVRHASTGKIAFGKVSGSIYFDLKSPDLQQVLEKISSSNDIAATLDSFNPQQPQYKELKAALARARSKGDGVDPATKPKAPRAWQGGSGQTSRIDVVLANMERWRWLPRDLGAAYVIVNIPDYTLTVMNDGKSVWSTRIVVGQPGKHATPLLAETMKYITFNPTWNVPPSIIRNEYSQPLRETRPRSRGSASGSAATATAQFEYINHLASGTRLVACASTFQINSLFISTTHPTNICSASLRVLIVMAVCVLSIPTSTRKSFFQFLSRRTVILFRAFARSTARASGISI